MSPGRDDSCFGFSAVGSGASALPLAGARSSESEAGWDSFSPSEYPGASKPGIGVPTLIHRSAVFFSITMIRRVKSQNTAGVDGRC